MWLPLVRFFIYFPFIFYRDVFLSQKVIQKHLLSKYDCIFFNQIFPINVVRLYLKTHRSTCTSVIFVLRFLALTSQKAKEKLTYTLNLFKNLNLRVLTSFFFLQSEAIQCCIQTSLLSSQRK